MHQAETPDMLAAALAWQAAGCSVVAASTDGTKSPRGQWKHAQQHAATPEQLHAWFHAGHPGLGVVCGAVSGHLEMLELEGRAVADGTGQRYLDALDQHGHGELKQRILGGYTELSPSGGLHFFYRVHDGVAGNTKLAQRPGRPDPVTSRPATLTLIETRGEGGFVIVAPSHGPTHPTGKPWTAAVGSPEAIPTITADERDALHAVATLFDEMPPPEPIPDPIPLERRDTGSTPPGEDFNARATWREILEPAGWIPVRQLGNRTYWRRPGKHIGISAVTGGTQGDYCYVWSTSTELPAEQAMSKWRVYALLEHGGDFPAAASALRRKGYGTPAPEPTRPVLTVLPTRGATATQPAPDTTLESTYERSDDGNALALVDRFGDHIRFCPDRGRWLQWTGTRWEWCPSGGGPVREYAKRIARALPNGTDSDTKRWKQRSLSALGTTNMLIQAATDPRIVTPIAALDARQLELNTPAGVVDLTTGRLRPPDPAALHTRITAVAPDPDADPGRWLAFLADTFAGHDELPAYLQRLIGYCASGVVHDHVLPFAFGPGANGKGVFLETLRAVLGDYATTAPSGFLMAKVYASHETEIARLSGARMVVCSEVNENDRFDEAKVKQLTGGDTLTARFMRMDHFTFQPTHKLWLMGNHQPTVNGGGHSFWRRLRIIPFSNTVPEEKRVEDLQGILSRDHGPAILAWIIAGAAAYFTGGLAEPGSVRAATAEYEHTQDTISQFVEECCHLGGAPHVQTRANVVLDAYRSWCRGQGVDPLSATAFGTTVKTRFGVTTTGGGRKGRFYAGLALADTGDGHLLNRKDLA